MKKQAWIFLLLVLVGCNLLAGPLPDANELRVTVLYDNYLAAEGLQADWGFPGRYPAKKHLEPEGRSGTGRYDRYFALAR
ncbi:MAG: hypothetical protein MUC72_08905 [Acidobacteria bacterium]|nr:hypothetical protein [Acidobacteriota bacterium]